MSKTSQYTKEEITATALELVRVHGHESLTARALSKAVGCSTSPLFTVFRNIDAIRDSVRIAAAREFEEYVSDAINYEPPFKEYGLRLIRYAMNEPNLFRLIFLTDSPVKESVNPFALECMEEVKQQFGLKDEQRDMLLQQVWIYACGMAMLILSGAEKYSEEEISGMLSRQFASTMMLIQSDYRAENITPHHK